MSLLKISEASPSRSPNIIGRQMRDERHWSGSSCLALECSEIWQFSPAPELKCHFFLVSPKIEFSNSAFEVPNLAISGCNLAFHRQLPSHVEFYVFYLWYNFDCSSISTSIVSLIIAKLWMIFSAASNNGLASLL